MTRKENREVSQQMLNVYRGILFNHQEFEAGDSEEVVYEFDCPQFAELRNKYDLVRIGGKGSDFIPMGHDVPP